MKRRIVVEIDCEEKTCGDCEKRMGYTCDQFRKFLRWGNVGGYRRCPACKRAEA